MNGRLKSKILRRDNFQCRFATWDGKKWNVCGATKDLTIDHVIPTSRGGHPEKKANLVSACFKCNQRKANMTPEEAGMKIVGPGYIPPGRLFDHKTELSPLVNVNHRRAGRKRRRKMRRQYKKDMLRKIEYGEFSEPTT